VLERWAHFGELLELVGTRIDRFALDEDSDRHDALAHRDRGSLMRHYFYLLPLSLSPPALSGGVPPRTLMAPLIPRL